MASPSNIIPVPAGLSTLTMEVQVSAGGLPVALPVVLQAPVCRGHSLLQALDPVTHIALLALAAPLILQHGGTGEMCQ